MTISGLCRNEKIDGLAPDDADRRARELPSDGELINVEHELLRSGIGDRRRRADEHPPSFPFTGFSVVPLNGIQFR
jgi:hypothetical protein